MMVDIEDTIQANFAVLFCDLYYKIACYEKTRQ